MRPPLSPLHRNNNNNNNNSNGSNKNRNNKKGDNIGHVSSSSSLLVTIGISSSPM